MNQKIFTLKIVLIFCLGLFSIPLFSDDCPPSSCTVDLPPNMPQDTIYLGTLPNGVVGTYYDNSLSFRMPMTTTPVNQVDPTIPAGLTIDEITVLSLTNLPAGISWEANETVYEPAVETDGCFSFFGTPLQAGTFLIEVTVEASILVFSQEATFFVELIIEPSTSVTEGFSMTNNTGCGSVTVSFENNIPSNGEDGFSYQWDFGNGNTTTDENPFDQTYSEPGVYIVSYQAEIDTVGYILTRAVVTGLSGCNDIPTAPDWSTKPDLHIEIRDPNGNLVYTSETVWNTDPPIEYFPNIELLDGNYELKVIDTDSGINGDDDICGQVNFNKLSNGPIITGDFNSHIDIIHPVDIVGSVDTVWVFEVPDTPMITDLSATSFCDGEMTVLMSSYLDGNQWFKDGIAIVDATDAELEVEATGVYSVVYTNTFGCSAESEGVSIEFFDLPDTPEYGNENNLLSLSESIVYPDDYTFQWYLNNEVLVGETEPFHCAMQDGEYTLEVVDPTTGCSNIFVENIIYNADAECFVNTTNLADNWNLQIFPNPIIDVLNLSFDIQEFGDFELSVFDLYGRRHYFKVQESTANLSQHVEIDLNHLVSGMYLLELKSKDRRVTQKFVKE